MGTYAGKCFCGEVQIEVSGSPAAMGFCHCTSCREWSAAPVNAFSLWKTSTVRVTKGEKSLGTFIRKDTSHRQFCTKCGGHLMTRHPMWDLIDVYSAIIPTFEFEPQVHVNYGEKVLTMKDGLPKMKDLPKEMGGSGQTLPE